MYRLLKARGVTVQKNYTKSLQNNVQSSMKVCSFCKFLHPKTAKLTINYLQHRHQSTTIHTAVLDTQVPKKIKRKSKRYAELLEVSENVTNNRKASVRKLNADHLSLLIDQPDITLDKLHKINISKIQKYEDPQSAHDFMIFETTTLADEKTKSENETAHERDDDIAIIEDLEASGISDPAGLIKSSSFLETLQEDAHRDDTEEEAAENVQKKERSNKSKKLQTKEEEDALKSRNRELIMKGREETLARSLYSFIQVCLTCGMTARAWQTLMQYRRTGLNKSGSGVVRDVRLFNLLLNSYAGCANMLKIKEILRILKDDSIQPSPQTYAAVLESFGRLRKREKEREFMDTIVLEMKENGITFNDIVKSTTFLRDQRKHTMKAIKILQPDFKPIDDVPDFSYDCRLLKNIQFGKARPDSSAAKDLLTLADLKNKLSEQLKLEIQGDVVVKSIDVPDELKHPVIFARKIVAQIEASWTKAALKAFDRNLLALKNRECPPCNQRLTLLPYLCVLKKEDYVNAIITHAHRLADGSETFSLPITSLCNDLGRTINRKYEVEEKQRMGVMEKIEKVYIKYCDWYLNPDDRINGRVAWETIEQQTKKKGASLNPGNLKWPSNIHYNVGKFLYDIILKDIKFDINCLKVNSTEKHDIPAFYTLFRFKGKRCKEEIKPHPLLVKLYRESKPETLTFPTPLVPSVCPPKPWSSIHDGGYIVLKSEVVRVPMNSTHQWERFEEAGTKRLSPVLDCLNQLAAVPWTVNEPVLDIVVKVFREGGSVKLNVPQPPSVLPTPPQLYPHSDRAERISVAKQRMELQRRKGEMYSLWCDSLYRLSLADHFRGKIFWLPHNMDFRGRVYPIPPHLNHLGSDLARSLLVFALGKPLGPKGLDWLKLHTINLTGFKKRDPVRVRLEYANEVMDKILDSAENPLDGQMWWAGSDEPWQTLAACMEIAKALKSGDPENYVSGFPIHQDGSCNGLQHYAALGRDQIGAENVNLHPFDTPQDVYSSVAAMVNELRKQDAANGVEIASILEGFVKRKVIKQTVMTTVYGVTKFGAKLQIARQLKDIDDFPQEHVWAASVYLVNKTFDSLRTMFESAREIQDWFTECARIISISCGQNVEWVTPLGLPIVQPYTKQDKYSPMKDNIIYMDRPNTMKQKNAFPPNFVHSLDSSHMMLTSLYCENENLTFMSVHDCYWTHACTVEKMNKICREQFVALHSEPILDDLSRFLLTKYGYVEGDLNGAPGSSLNAVKRKINYTLSNVPKQGNFDLKGVLESTYFFS
ncbi:DNA-directed RNA polymerase, mitochondrial [Venturia canescens]|uniref:DNA-directed RNA polymerase, mitochondrial n=1 Tax=Venturia canescens TaxID=32260 RepID=UPI001C9BD326|nr:DNA-directed RNA polymerase, mitochondrial [Venturia canescens]